MHILHMCLNVADVEQSIAFYEQFGFEESWGFESGDTVNRYVADDEGTELQLSQTEGETEFDSGTAWDHIAFRVDDVDATVESVDHHGIVKEPGPQPAAGAYTAFIEDPDGHHVELIEPLDD
ncbi:VOC family protein [Halorarius litoreus]|uniref:VOC family protein n=1 Tax=Halorarius litoreus TaxID=2962676 RepID=UPI0020CE08BA|nr:VOC family protein [Halorarius litoreus]